MEKEKLILKNVLEESGFENITLDDSGLTANKNNKTIRIILKFVDNAFMESENSALVLKVDPGIYADIFINGDFKTTFLIDINDKSEDSGITNLYKFLSFI